MSQFSKLFIFFLINILYSNILFANEVRNNFPDDTLSTKNSYFNIIPHYLSILSVNATPILADDFEDGDLSGWGNIADWASSTDSPINGNYSLKHNLTSDGSSDAQSYIYHDISTLDLNTKTVIWKFNMKNGAWDPSSTSKFWFYLLANESNLDNTTVDGYAVGVNLTGYDDLITLWKVTDGAADQAIITSSFNWDSSDLVGIEVHRSTSGEWTLYFQEGGGFDNMTNAGSATNTDYTFTDYCGLVFHIIDSRKGQLWFDDLKIELDEYPPVLQSVLATDENNLRLKFNEALDQTSAETTTNYTVDNSIGNPQSAVLDTDPSIVKLNFANAFSENIQYEINIQNISDLNSNILNDTTANFTYIPFRLENLFVLDETNLMLEFSRNLDAVSAENTANYTVDNSIGNPQTATLQSETNKVLLNFSSSFPENTQLNLHIENLEDENNVVISPTDTGFYWHNTQPYELVINEIMADPVPPVALPEVEYLEIYNTTGYTICLDNWKMQIGTVDKTFPVVNIEPDEYLLICSEAAQDSLQSYGKTVGILGSSDLTNAGKELALKNSNDLTIDTVYYHDTWYQDPDKDNGGWSIERIDPENTCGQLSNWKAATDIAGGTPGKINSIYRPNIDTIAPKLISFYAIANKIYLQFDDELDKSNILDLNNYLLNNTTNPQTTSWEDESSNKILLQFADTFTVAQHTLNISAISDLCGNSNTIDTVFDYYPGYTYDLVINEIMCDINPEPNNLPPAKYIEIFNKSDKKLKLKDWQLNINETQYTFPDIQIAPDSFLILCDEDDTTALSAYGTVLGIFSYTNLSVSEGSISLRNAVDDLIDTVHYFDTWYQDPDKDNGGWSLERIDPENTCGQLSNWKAATDIAGGTPGKINSIYQPNIDTIAPNLTEITILNARQIQLQFDDELFTGNISDINNYLLDNSINPQSAVLLDNIENIVLLDFANDFSIGQHSLSISNIQDLCGNTEPTDTSFYYYPGFAFDILINEMMLDISPEPNVLPAAKFIELYNKTDVDIRLNGWMLNINDASYTFDKVQIPAKSYLILCDDDETALFENYGQVEGIFSSTKLSADEGQISLYNAGNEFIDYVHYSDTWYQDEEKNSGGWSLERIDPMNYCGQAENWKASEDYKGGTPGAENSIFTDNPDTIRFELLNISVLSSVRLRLQFSKNLSESEALNPQNYLVDNNVGNPLFVDFSDTSRTSVVLQFAYQFTDAYTHTLTISNLTDFCGKQLENNKKQFVYYLISPKSAYAESPKIVKITFSEEVEKITAEQIVNYTIEELGNPVKAYKHSSLTNTVYLEFSAEFENGKEYTLHIESVKDLNGNAMRPADLAFTWFMPAGNELVINEVLFNPKSGGVDYVEIYNNALHPVDLSLMKIANRDDENQIVNPKDLSDTNNLLYPMEYLCITSDTIITKNDYPAPSYGRFVQLSSMPSYPDDAGTVVLQFADTIIDEFAYNADMHSALISDANGVSLERLNPDAPTQDRSNWYSAAQSVGYGTPANKNSQFSTGETTDFEDISVEPEVFSPDGDGYNDRVFIRYKFSEPGYIGSLSIYNKSGQEVKRIANNELLATEGSFAWDGMYENGQRATLGIYVIYFEVFNLQGEVKTYKKTCVVAAKLK